MSSDLKGARRGVGYGGAAALTAAALASGLFTDVRAEAAPADRAAEPTQCVLEVLPIPNGDPMALTSGVDPTGRYIVGRTYPQGGGYRAVIWKDGLPTAVDLPADEEESLADVNSEGTAVGWSYQDLENAIPYVYSGGQVSALPGVKYGHATEINDAGVILGEDAEGAPLVWPSATDEPTLLPLPEGTRFATANGLDEDGTVVGNLDFEQPYVWFADGTHREIPLPVIDGVQAESGLVGDVRNGWVVGWAARPDGPGSVGFRWNLRTGESRMFDEFPAGADAVTGQGWQVGLAQEFRALYVTDTGAIKLPALFDHPVGGLTNLPDAVSDDGSLVTGQSEDEAGVIKPVVWRCE